MKKTNEGWALGMVQNMEYIPEELRSEFYDELVSEDVVYRKILEEAVRKYGVRWF